MRARSLAFALVLAACRREPPPSSGDPSLSANPPPPALAPVSTPAGDAAPALVELLHAVPMAVRVSSRVANAAIHPEHLVDRDLDTAWNSRTGDLEGSWIEIALPAGATLEQLRMTAGHTGKGAKGEDYFTMNPRIQRVSVLKDGAVLAAFSLDIARRDLQPLAVHATGTVRIRVDAVVPGTMKRWRETCVSELEAWGTPPAGWSPPAKPLVPTVEVDAPAPAASAGSGSAWDHLCDEANAAAEEREKQGQASVSPDCTMGCDDHNFGGSCLAAADVTEGLAPPWHALGSKLDVTDRIYGPATCTIMLETDAGLFEGTTIEMESAHGSCDIISAATEKLFANDPPVVVVRYRKTYPAATEQLVACRPVKQKPCSDPIDVAGDGWSVRARVDRGGVVQLKPDKGNPPAKTLGAHAFVFH